MDERTRNEIRELGEILRLKESYPIKTWRGYVLTERYVYSRKEQDIARKRLRALTKSLDIEIATLASRELGPSLPYKILKFFGDL